MKRLFFILHAAVGILVSACSVQDPSPENVPELITRAVLTFTPDAGSAATLLTVTATDPDNIGPADISVDAPIRLKSKVSYTLTITLYNDLIPPGADGHDVSAVVQEEGQEHQFFFGFSNDLFTDPAGTGNLDHRTGIIRYTGPLDNNGRPIGLMTAWQAGEPAHGNFRMLLKHQPGLKSDSTDSTDGESDLDLTFEVIIE